MFSFSVSSGSRVNQCRVHIKRITVKCKPFMQHARRLKYPVIAPHLLIGAKRPWQAPGQHSRFAFPAHTRTAAEPPGKCPGCGLPNPAHRRACDSDRRQRENARGAAPPGSFSYCPPRCSGPGYLVSALAGAETCYRSRSRPPPPPRSPRSFSPCLRKPNCSRSSSRLARLC